MMISFNRVKRYSSKNRIAVSSILFLSLLSVALAILLFFKNKDRNDYRDSYLSVASYANSKDTEIKKLEGEVNKLNSDKSEVQNSTSYDLDELNTKVDKFDNAIRSYFKRDFDAQYYRCDTEPNINLPTGKVVTRTVEQCKQSVLSNFSTSWAEAQ